mmetsp:Transcript_84125/g.123020  ORF Transcript_84125/g.123020 Transcript_84125/m.123020 type:complete len:209 (+) Transcript_84125:4119-4745(+)
MPGDIVEQTGIRASEGQILQDWVVRVRSVHALYTRAVAVHTGSIEARNRDVCVTPYVWCRAKERNSRIQGDRNHVVGTRPRRSLANLFHTKRCLLHFNDPTIALSKNVLSIQLANLIKSHLYRAKLAGHNPGRVDDGKGGGHVGKRCNIQHKGNYDGSRSLREVAGCHYARGHACDCQLSIRCASVREASQGQQCACGDRNIEGKRGV